MTEDAAQLLRSETNHTPAQYNARMRKFIVQYASALALEVQGTHVVVYTDESYIHQHYCSGFGWFSDAEPERAMVSGKPPDNGTRLIMLNAISSGGVLSSLSTMAAASNDVGDAQPTAQFVFESMGTGEDSDDYHKSIDGEMYLQWLEHRLIPAFEHFHPGKRMVLVLDNASYHHLKHPLAVSSKSMTEVQCRSYAEAYGLQLPVVRGRARVQPLRDAVAAHQQAHPELFEERVTALLHRFGHYPVYTPPYASDTQPIELYWGTCKGDVARSLSGTRTVDELRAAVDKAMLAVSADACRRLIGHVHSWLNAWLSDTRQGSHLAQRYPTLEVMVSAAERGTLATDGLID
jgi:transposase